MATIGVLTYTLPPGLKLNTNFIKQSSSQQQTNFHNNNSTIITKIEDISMFTSQVTNTGDVLVMRKKQKLNPLQETANNNNNQNKIIHDLPKPPPAKKQKLSINTTNNNNNNNLPAVGKNMTITTSLPLNNISNIIQPPAQVTISSIPNKQSSSNPIDIKTNPIINGGKKSQPLPQAVARRNARERNRVKQVNNGFAQLRQRIPDEVAEAFEAAGNGRGTAKKLSKVETLRMAVEYIRSLENILGIEYTSVGPLMDIMSPLPSDDETSLLMNSKFMSPSTDTTVIKTEYCSSPPTSDDHERFDDNSLYDPDESSVYFTDNLPDVTTINGQQYLRIPGTNTYQLIAQEVFENEENIHPLVTSSPLISTPSPDINYIDNSITGLVNSGQQQQQLGYNLSGGMLQQQQQQQQQISPNLINVNNAPALISPDQYSNNNSIGMQSSTSPAIIVDQHIQQQQQILLSQMQMHQNQLLNRQENHNQLLLIKTEHLQQQHQQQQQQQVHVSSPVEIIKMNYNQLAPNSSPLSTNDDENQGYSISSNELQLYDGVMTHKHKIKIENECNTASILLDNNTTEVNAAAVAGLSDESMMEAIDWWEAHTPKSEQGSVM